MKQLLLHMQLIIGKKTRKLKDLDSESIEHAILECEIETGKVLGVLAIEEFNKIQESDKVQSRIVKQ